jgi:hypothetical protein
LDEKTTPEARTPANVVRMFHPAGGTNDAHPVDGDGFQLVPNGPAVAVMRSHGFLVEGERPQPQAAPELVPAEALQHAVDRIHELEATLREHRHDAKLLGEQLEIANAKVADLEKRLAEVPKASPKNKG